MINEVSEILKIGLGGVLKSPVLTISLLRCYSKLYMNGAECSTCEASLRKYFNILIKDGMKKAIDFEAIKLRTCKPSFKGMVFSPKAGHINPDYLSDDQAEFYLLNGILSETHFLVLPENYLKNKKIVEPEIKPYPIIEPEIVNTTNEKKTYSKKLKK
jgi:hypothetical protein